MPDTPSIRAEQALLGAILSDEQTRSGGARRLPRVLDQVTWIRSADFARPYHREVWFAIQVLKTEGKNATPAAVRKELARSSELPKDVAGDGRLLHDLMQSAPVTAHGPMYAGMVLTRHLHMEMQLEASRLDQAARSGRSEALTRARAGARRRITELRARWERVPDSIRTELDRNASTVPPTPAELHLKTAQLAAHMQVVQGWAGQRRTTSRPLTLADMSIMEMLATVLNALVERLATALDRVADKVIAPRQAGPRGCRGPSPRQPISSQPPTPMVHQIQHERTTTPGRSRLEGRLIGSLIRDPGQLDRITLSPAQIADPDVRQMYMAARDLHAAGTPVDELTVIWTVQRAGGNLDPSDATRNGIAQGLTGEAAYLADQVQAAAAGDHTIQAAERIRQSAADPRIPPSRLLSLADAELIVMPAPPPNIEFTTPGRSPHEPNPQELELERSVRRPRQREREQDRELEHEL